MNTSTPFYKLTLCRFCGSALVGSEVERGVCGHCRGDFLAPQISCNVNHGGGPCPWDKSKPKRRRWWKR